MATKVTLKEIAQEVGLSPSAVSLVLNDRPCRISDENRRRIKEVAARKRYVPNQIARSLVMQQSRTLGLIVPNIMSRFFSSFARNLEVRCRERGYALFIMNSDGKTENDADLVRLLINRGVDGIFLVAAEEVSLDPAHGAARGGIVPVVMVDRSIENALATRFDSTASSADTRQAPARRGHRRIACVVNTASHTGRDRLAGCRRAFAEAGAPLGEDLVFESDYYIADGCRAAERIVASDATAIFASSDNIALGVLKCLHAHGKRVPRDYSLVSYDNSAADALFEPALTAIEQDVEELADHALELLLARVEAKDGTPPVRGAVLPPRLVQNASVSRPNAHWDRHKLRLFAVLAGCRPSR
ncbi:MAG: LacI family DNA-binding transcriptional regulator [Collinsella intestinalis]